MKLNAEIAMMAIIIWMVASSHATISDQDSGIRHLFNSLSSSSEEEPQTHELAQSSEERLANRSASPQVELRTSPQYLSTTEYFSPEGTSNMDIPPPQRLVPNIRSKINTERELETTHADAKELRVKQIKSSLLSKLRLKQLPNPRLADFVRFPHHILAGMPTDGLPMDEPEKEDNYHAKIDQVIRFAQQVPAEKAIRIPDEKLNSTLYFPIPFRVTEESLEVATMLVYIDGPEGYVGERTTLNVFLNPWSKAVTSREVVLTEGGHWEHIDITAQCKSWVRNEWKNNLGISVEAEIGGMNLVNYMSNISSNESMARLPLVKLQLNPKEYNRRNKRSSHSDAPLSCHPEDNEERCCKYPFVLDFDELGSDFKFILSPKRFWANYCKGICPDYVLPVSTNSQITRGVNKAQRCCRPLTDESLTLIYINDDGDIIRGVLPGISITSCGCD